MNKTYIYSYAIVAFLLFSSFKGSTECEYAGANIDFARTKTEKAIAIDDINQARYLAYKALNAIEKSKKQLEICGCEFAEQNLLEGLKNLKLATKATTLDATRIYLLRSLENTMGSLNALQDHHLHKVKFNESMAIIDTVDTASNGSAIAKKPVKLLYQKIDASLEKYSVSLSKVVETVNCKEARAFTSRIIEHCEKELLRDNLSEGKIYYNLRTKEITLAAHRRIGTCAAK